MLPEDFFALTAHNKKLPNLLFRQRPTEDHYFIHHSLPKTAVETCIAAYPAFTPKGSVAAASALMSAFRRLSIYVYLYRRAVEGTHDVLPSTVPHS